MSREKKEWKAWGVIEPTGMYLYWTTAYQRKLAISAFLRWINNRMDWETARKRGYRVEKVVIRRATK